MYSDFFLDTHQLTSWPCRYINQPTADLVPSADFSAVLLCAIGPVLSLSQGGQQTMHTHTEPPFAPTQKDICTAHVTKHIEKIHS